MICNQFRCTQCSAFISTRHAISTLSDVVFCRCCGTSIYLSSVDAPLHVQRPNLRSEARSPVSATPSIPLNISQSNLKPNGKMQRSKISCVTAQMDLFGGAI